MIALSSCARAVLASLSLAALLTAGPALAADNSDLIRRLEALEKRVQQLEGRNAELEDQNKVLVEKDRAIEEKIDYRTQRLETVENRAGTIVKPDVAPTFGDPNGNFSFKVRGILNTDFVHFDGRAGGYNYNSGTAIRKLRFGFDGTAFKMFVWRVEPEFANNAVSLLDAYVSYTGVPNWTFTAGQAKAPFNFEFNSPVAYLTFLERGTANTAIGALVGERRLGLVATYGKNPFTLSIGVQGDNEASVRADTSPRESMGVNARGTWEPILDADLQRALHFGATAAWRTDLKSGAGTTAVNNSIRLTDRPNIRVDNGNIADTGAVPNVKDVLYLGGEFVGIYKNLSLQAEYNRLHAYRDVANLPGLDFDGGYVYGSWFITGESRTLRGGVLDRLRPVSNFNPAADGWGAFELAVRYDWFDFSDTPVAARAGNKGSSVTTALNWYLNPNLKLMLNWVRFEGTNTPLDPIGARTEGDAYGVRLHLDW